MPHEAEDLVTMLKMLEQHDADAQKRMVQYLVSKVGFPVFSHVEKHVEKRRGRPVENHVFNLDGGALGGNGSSSEAFKAKNRELDVKATEVLEFLNVKAGKSFQPVDENLRFIRARLAKHSVEDMKGVIARKTREWINTDQRVFLRPKTLFNATNFANYIGEQPRV